MYHLVKRFLRDERGNATIESLVVIGGSVWMMGVVLTDISVATMGVTNRLESRLEYTSIINDILVDYGPNSEASGGSNEVVDCDANPGNDKCVGNAGENPNNVDDPDSVWGTGSNGQGDTSSNNGNIGGNSSNAPGQNQ